MPGHPQPQPHRPRIVSLVPSATEILCAVGGRDLLVGRSHECDYPTGLQAIPALTGQKITSTDPAEIDRQVRSQLQSGTSLYSLDADRLAALRPDLILTQNPCSVCSIDLPTVQRLAADLRPRPEVLALDPLTLDDVLDDILRIADAAGLQPQGVQAVVQLRERLFQAEEFTNPFVDGPTVAFLEWTDPLFVGGHWTPQLLERAGARHPLNPTVPKPGTGSAIGPQQAERIAGKSITIPDNVLAGVNPDMLVFCPCGVDLAGTEQMVRSLAGKSWFGELKAVRSGRVALVDGNQMFNRPGPRLVDAFEWAVGWINDRPGIIPAGFPWRPWRS